MPDSTMATNCPITWLTLNLPRGRYHRWAELHMPMIALTDDHRIAALIEPSAMPRS